MILTHGANSIQRRDPRILLLWYGTDKDYMPPSEQYSGLTTLYDPNGPLDVAGTGWSGTPCVSKSGLGGLVHTSGTKWIQLNKGLHWRQPEILSQFDKSKPWTFEFWLRNDYGNTGNFGDGDDCVSFMSKQGSDINVSKKDSDGIVPCPSLTGWYASARYKFIYSAAYISDNVPNTSSNVFANALKWVHFALTYNGNGDKSGLRLFINGSEAKASSNRAYGYNFNDYQFGLMFKDLQALSVVTSTDSTCNWRIAQICLLNFVRYTKNFTPQRKPYYMGLDAV